MIFEQGPSKTLYYFSYDFMNRLIKKEERGSQGIRLIERFRYDYLGNQVASSDIYGNETLVEYDEFSRPIKIIQPEVLNEKGKPIRPEIHKEYDLLGNVTALTDPHGHRITTSYTIRGKPCHICHPDGSQESFEYTLQGLLKKAVARNGSFTCYDYDFLGRSIKEEVYSPEGECLKSISRRYNAFHLLEEIDAEGVATTYAYDGAGRLIKEERGDARTDYLYDPEGHLRETRKFFNEYDYIATIQIFDLWWPWWTF